MKIRRLLLVMMAAVVVAGGGIWYAKQVTTVNTVEIGRGDAAEAAYATGVVEPLHWTRVASLVRERIVEECDCEGQPVQAGHILARLDDRAARAALTEAQERLRLAEDEYRRLSALAQRQAVHQQELDRARMEVARLEALVAGEQVRVDRHVIRAPMAGVVLRRDAEVGQIAEPDAALFWVGQPRPLVVMADVNEEDIPRVAVDQKVLLSSDAFPDRHFEAVVDRITPKGDPTTRTYRVRILLPDDTPLMVGMTADVNVIVRVCPDVLLAPSLALQDEWLYVVEDDRAHRRRITIGIRGMEAVEVQSGLDEGDRIIVPYPESLADGARVRVHRQQE